MRHLGLAALFCFWGLLAGCDAPGEGTTCLCTIPESAAVLNCGNSACVDGGGWSCEAGVAVANPAACAATGCTPSCEGAQCGDDGCASEEAGSDCVDCAPGWRDWDGRCSWFEQWRSDCGTCADGRCNDGEDERCPEDCVGCGDSVCAPGERDRCPRDCPGCGNALCEPGEADDFAPAYCPLDCLPCEADRPGCFDEGVISCDAAGAVVDYTPCPAGDLCVAGACVGAGICGNGRCEQDEVCPADCN